MGASASAQKYARPTSGGNQRPGVKKAKSLKALVPQRKGKIFDKGTVSVEALDAGHWSELDPATESMLLASLGRVLFEGIISESATALILKNMKRTYIDAGTQVVTQGDLGSTMYIVENGHLQVSVNGQIIKELQRGDVFGELCILFNAPRSATVLLANLFVSFHWQIGTSN